MTISTDLDERCGEHFAYRDLVACGETWHRLSSAGAPVDRLYLYAPDRPIHVSVGPERSRQIVHMRRGPSGG
jgi:hypothetical protein